MQPDIKSRADARLDAAAAGRGFADPRPPLRERLRQLKEGHAAAFEAARAHYEQQVVPALDGGPDPIAAWVEYGAFLASLTAPGRILAIDGAGGAQSYRQPEDGMLVLHVPDDTAAPVLVLVSPAQPSAAQQATLDLLVHRRLSL